MCREVKRETSCKWSGRKRSHCLRTYCTFEPNWSHLKAAWPSDKEQPTCTYKFFTKHQETQLLFTYIIYIWLIDLLYSIILSGWLSLHSKGVFTWYWDEFHSGTSSSWFPLVALYSFTWYRHKMSYRCESYWYEFIPVLIPVRNVRTGMRFDHILYWYHVKEIQGFVPVRDEWLSWLGGVAHACR